MDKVLTLLGFARKAGRLSFGMDTAVSAIKSDKSKLIVAAGDVSEKSLKEISFFADKKNIPLISLENTDMEILSKAVGKKCGIISVNDSSFAEAITGTHRRNDK